MGSVRGNKGRTRTHNGRSTRGTEAAREGDTGKADEKQTSRRADEQTSRAVQQPSKARENSPDNGYNRHTRRRLGLKSFGPEKGNGDIASRPAEGEETKAGQVERERGWRREEAAVGCEGEGGEGEGEGERRGRWACGRRLGSRRLERSGRLHARRVCVEGQGAGERRGGDAALVLAVIGWGFQSGRVWRSPAAAGPGPQCLWTGLDGLAGRTGLTGAGLQVDGPDGVHVWSGSALVAGVSLSRSASSCQLPPAAASCSAVRSLSAVWLLHVFGT